MQKKRKVPLRKCVGCQEQKPKKEMVRIVHNKNGAIEVDLTGKAHGRGAYICPQRTCLELAEKKKSLNRAFSCEVSQDVLDKLYEVFETYEK